VEPNPEREPTLRQLELLLTLVTSDGIASAGARLNMTLSTIHRSTSRRYRRKSWRSTRS
jgi:hypothetical protein